MYVLQSLLRQSFLEEQQVQAGSRRRWARPGPLTGLVFGIVIALLYGTVGSANPARPSFAGRTGSLTDLRQVDALEPQSQAEALLELAVSRSNGAVEQISSRLNGWRGKVKWDPEIASLTSAALNSNDLGVRESGVEVELAAYGLSKDSASLDYVLKTAKSRDHSRKIWALWALGLMANRGVETERVMEVLTKHLQDSDQDTRRWAVQGLAVTGTEQAIAPLLKTMHDDRSAMVRERAACSLAESGTFTADQRYTAVPQLLNYTEDPTLDAQTQAWAFQALGEITHQRLPNNAAAWRNWYRDAGQAVGE